MRVNIPKPCNENWGEMSPAQRGAFCQTCAIDVIDFSNKNPEEVKETLKANIGKHICGRFKKSQLSDLSRTYQIWENQSTKTFQSKFLWACMIAFGLTLFTGCENSNAQELVDDDSKISHKNNYLDIEPLSELAIKNINNWYVEDNFFYKICNDWINTTKQKIRDD